MELLTGITKIALSPLKGVGEVIKDPGMSILTLGIVPFAKGTLDAIKDGVDDIFED